MMEAVGLGLIYQDMMEAVGLGLIYQDMIEAVGLGLISRYDGNYGWGRYHIRQ